MYITYRRNFSPITAGDTVWTSDVGWGCAIRSGQMMIAQAFLDHLKSRSKKNCNVHSGRIASVVSLFWDSPLDEHVFSIHHICKIASRHGVEPGSWMGPGFVSRVLCEIVNLTHPFNVHAALISTPAGASCITPEKIEELQSVFSNNTELNSTPQNAPNQPPDEEDPLGLASLPPGLLIMIPLLLGTSKMHPRYMRQVKETLTWTQSIGIIGGRSSSSMYLVGFQDSEIFHLDPHKPRTVTSSPQEFTTYFNAPLKVMSEDVVITSLSLGFYCKTKMELCDLMEKLQQMEKESDGAPIITFLEKNIPNCAAPSSTWSLPDEVLADDDDDIEDLSDWEVINV
eukprot:g1173.t1